MVPPPRARSGKGALAPSCCSPHGHDQTSEQMSFFRFSQLAAATSRCNTHLRQNELSQVGVCSTCGGRKPNFGGKNVGKIDNWTKNRRTNKEKKCGSRLAAATSRAGKKGGKMCKKEGRSGQNHRECGKKVVRIFATQSKEYTS